MSTARDRDTIEPSETADSMAFDFGDLDPSVFDPGNFAPPDLNPDILLPRFEIWVHGNVGMQVFSPTPESAFSIMRRAGGIHVSPSGSGSDKQVNIVFPLPWPPVVPVGSSLAARQPFPTTAMVLYRTYRAKIRGIVLLEAVGNYGQIVASVSVNWSGSHVTGLDSDNVVPLTANPRPRFGLAMAVITEFDSTTTAPHVHIASAGLQFRIPSS